MMPHDVPFDERLFESNSLLKQYWETSVSGRNSMASLNVQRRAQEDDHKHQTLEFYNSLVTLTANQESPEVPEAPEMPAVTEAFEVPEAPVETVADIEAPVASGPVMKPKSVTYGLSVLSLILLIVIVVLAASVALYYYNGFPGVSFFGGSTAVATAIEGGAVEAAVSAVTELAASVPAVSAPVVAAVQAPIAAGRIARFEL